MKTAGKTAAVVCALVLGAGFAAGAGENDLVRAELIAETLTVSPGSVVTVSLRLEIAEGWHIYWKNPGDSGLPTRITWILPEGVGASGTAWPAPRVFDDDAAVTFGYEGAADLLVEIDVFCGFGGGPVLFVGAEVEWLACREGCIPGNSRAELAISVADHEPIRDSRREEYFRRVRESMPGIPRDWRMSATAESGRIVLSVRFSEKERAVNEQVVFFPENEEIIDHGAPQELRADAGGFTLAMKRSHFASDTPLRLRGVLAASNVRDLPGDRSAVLVDVPMNRAGQAPRLDGEDRASGDPGGVDPAIAARGFIPYAGKGDKEQSDRRKREAQSGFSHPMVRTKGPGHGAASIPDGRSR